MQLHMLRDQKKRIKIFSKYFTFLTLDILKMKTETRINKSKFVSNHENLRLDHATI